MKTDDKTESACVASAANIHDPRAVRLWAEDSIPRPAGHAGAVEGRHGAAYPVATTGTCWSKRRAWDSNPRWVLPHSGFQDRRHRPLGEPSWRRRGYPGGIRTRSPPSAAAGVACVAVPIPTRGASVSVPITLACERYDRTEALRDGRVRPAGVDLTY